MRHLGRRDVFEHAPAEVHESIRAFHARFGTLLAHLSEPLRDQRIARAMALMLKSAADREQAHASGRDALALAVEVADLVDGVVGLLQAT